MLVDRFQRRPTTIWVSTSDGRWTDQVEVPMKARNPRNVPHGPGAFEQERPLMLSQMGQHDPDSTATGRVTFGDVERLGNVHSGEPGRHDDSGSFGVPHIKRNVSNGRGHEQGTI